jgi:hypothetical protein
MTRIVTTAYRYKRPPRKRKAVALEAPAVGRTEPCLSPSIDRRDAALTPKAKRRRES